MIANAEIGDIETNRLSIRNLPWSLIPIASGLTRSATAARVDIVVGDWCNLSLTLRGARMPETRSGTRLFLKQARRNFLNTGAIAPSSRYVARAATMPLRAALHPLEVLEAGAGTGALTREIVRLMPRGSHLDIYEINPSFAWHLEHTFSRADEVRVHNRGVLSIPPYPRYDAIVSGLPLNNFTPDQVREIFERLFSVLKPGGTMTYFEYLLIRGIKSLTTSREERRRLRRIGRVTNGFLRQYAFRKEAILMNIPPALVHSLRKPD
jgi:phospholipid N-methyltransferase